VSRGLPPGVGASFRLAAGELGMCSAAWLFGDALLAGGGPELVRELRAELGRDFPVLDAVTDLLLRGRRPPVPDPAPVLAAIGNARRVVVVGLETLHLDALLATDPAPRIALLRHGPFAADWDRVLANYGGRVETTDLDTFQTWAGPRSVLLAFAYGTQGHSTYVLPSWERVVGADVRTQFRALVAWDVLEASFIVYPRWLVEVSTDGFTHVVGGA
jgi:hypothetical protein